MYSPFLLLFNIVMPEIVSKFLPKSCQVLSHQFNRNQTFLWFMVYCFCGTVRWQFQRWVGVGLTNYKNGQMSFSQEKELDNFKQEGQQKIYPTVPSEATEVISLDIGDEVDTNAFFGRVVDLPVVQAGQLDAIVSCAGRCHPFRDLIFVWKDADIPIRNCHVQRIVRMLEQHTLPVHRCVDTLKVCCPETLMVDKGGTPLL